MAGEKIAGVGRIIFGDRVVKQFDRLTRDIRGGMPDLSESEFFDTIDSRIEAARDIVPIEAGILQNTAGHQRVRVLIVEFPLSTVAAVGPTPQRYPEAGIQHLMPSDIYRALVTGMAGLYSYGNTAVQNGAIHNDVIFAPVGDSSAKDEKMRLHVDGLYANRNQQHNPEQDEPNRNLSPDWLSFHFQRNNEKIPTVVVFPEWSELSDETFSTLQQPILNLGKGLPPVSVLYGDPQDPWIRYVTDNEYIEKAAGEAEKQALLQLNTHLFARQVPLLLGAGQILLLDNRRVLHGREARVATDLPQEEWRWQRRISHARDAQRIIQSEVSPRLVNPQTIYRNA